MSRKDVINELHRSARKNFPRKPFKIIAINESWQGDLCDLSAYAKLNKGYKWIALYIDNFSKFIYVRPMKDKSSKSVVNATKEILDESGVTPKNLQTDNGKEYYNSSFSNLMKKYGINHYSTFSNLKASIAERAIKTIKNKIWKHFSMLGQYKWVDYLDEIVRIYNSKDIHRTIGIPPAKVNKNNEKRIYNKAYNYPIQYVKSKFKIGDKVRISKYKGVFTKGYVGSWSTEIFTIRNVSEKYPTTYLLQDYEDKLISGRFYEEELQRVKHPDVYLVEKILKRNKGKLYVKWLGFDSIHNSWIDASAMV